MRRVASIFSVLGIAAVAVTFLPGVSKPAEALTGVCSFTIGLTVSPGLSLTPAAGTFTSGGETGSIDCDGTLHGTFGLSGVYGSQLGGGTCVGDTGSGHFTATVPTPGGTLHFAGTFTFAHAGPVGAFVAQGSGLTYAGAIQLLPTAGTCVLEPATQARVTGQGVLQI